ncbi:lipid droplet localized protein-like [Nymphalis io]|uniref:lipid droplet localized protein-like n=1 Tax=Inachis io TaxID=171585 RepID=UPI0021690D96|nr:lipid droplet localized protein-like [Nymphalis io]XP_050349651.1 lipid droplet localized protein-like [Nymphalis io]
MSRLDLIIFGATGFTGKHVVKMLASKVIENYPDLKWGVAGRSMTKLDAMLQEISNQIEGDITSVKKIEANVKDEESLKEMCLQCKVLVNCCGPFRLYGEPVVRAAVAARAHYVDVCGEPQFIEKMQLEYDEKAREAGVYVISACGFDSIPNDLGVIYLQKNFCGTLNSVESYISASNDVETRGFINYGTWESLIHSLAHYHELPALRKKLYPERLPPLEPKLKQRSLVHRRGRLWCVPFPGADASVVYRTQRRLHRAARTRPAQIKTYACFPSLAAALGALLLAALLFALSRWAAARALLLRHPERCSLGAVARGPAERAHTHARFAVRLYGRGWPAGADPRAPPDRALCVQVSGADPGYGMTALGVLYSALTILHEKDKMPECGVLTTGYAFKDTSIIQLLDENNIKFEMINRYG